MGRNKKNKGSAQKKDNCDSAITPTKTPAKLPSIPFQKSHTVVGSKKLTRNNSVISEISEDDDSCEIERMKDRSASPGNFIVDDLDSMDFNSDKSGLPSQEEDEVSPFQAAQELFSDIFEDAFILARSRK